MFLKELKEELVWRDISLKREIEEELACSEDFMELEDELAWRAEMLEREGLVELEDKLARREDMFGEARFRGRNRQGERDEISQAMFESLYLHKMNQKISAKEQELVCPVCLETASAPILMCEDQHLVCNNCR